MPQARGGAGNFPQHASPCYLPRPPNALYPAYCRGRSSLHVPTPGSLTLLLREPGAFSSPRPPAAEPTSRRGARIGKKAAQHEVRVSISNGAERLSQLGENINAVRCGSCVSEDAVADVAASSVRRAHTKPFADGRWILPPSSCAITTTTIASSSLALELPPELRTKGYFL